MQRLQGLQASLLRHFRQVLTKGMATDVSAVAEASSIPAKALTGRQEHVRFVTPQNKRRNFARRVLARQLQVAREARERQKNTTRNLQERDAKRIERWRQRAAWKAEALAAESA